MVVYRCRNWVIARSHRFWAEYSFEYFKVTLEKLENSKEMRREKHLLLTNHRTQADFFVHSILADHQASFLSRLLVGIIFFVFSLSANKSVWFFNRSGNNDPEKFNNWLDEKYRKSQRPLILAYPEGHRMGAISTVDKSKLKTGMIRYAYRRAMPIQMLMTFGNENIFNEKKLQMSWNEKVYYSFSKSYSPSDFQSENDFVRVIKDEFAKYFDEVYQLYQEKRGEVNEKNENEAEEEQKLH